MAQEPTLNRQKPHSLEEAFHLLPRRYFKVLTKPSLATFTEEMRKAEWSLVWVQLLGWIIAFGILGLLTVLITSFVLVFTGSLDFTLLGSTLGLIVLLAMLVPLLLFASTSLTYLTARVFGGKGSLLAQSYTSLLFQIPLSAISSVLLLISTVGVFLGALCSFVAFIYSMVLQVSVVMAVHRVDARTAIVVVFIPAAGGLLLTWCLLALTSASFA